MVLDTAPGDQTGWLGYVAIGEDSLRDYRDANAFSQGQRASAAATRPAAYRTHRCAMKPASRAGPIRT